MEIVPIPTDTYTLGFIGAGKMAESIAGGAVRSGVLPSSRIRTAHSNPSRRTAFESIGVTVLSSNEDVVRESNIVVFSVKPQVVKDVVLKLRPLLTKNKLLVSVAAGVKLKDLQEWAAHDRFIRVMPNTPAAIGEAASVMSLGGAATEEDGNIIAKLFGSVGKIWKADEKFFDAITGLSGSGPAYIYLAIEALADGGVAAGLPRDLSLSLASQTVGQVTSRINLSRLVYIGPIQCIVEKSDITLMHPNCVDASLDLDHNFFQVLGAASMVTQTKKHPGQLKDDVTSPGGTTIAGIHELEKGGFRGILMNAVVAAAKRSRELS